MARMIPGKISGQTESSAERRLFTKIESELSDDWSVLHSLGLASHSRKPWAEIDFVLVGPTGVYCLEVKGGGVACSNGVWTTKDKKGDTHSLKESPFSQVGSASAALHRFLFANTAAIKNSLTGYCVAVPDVTFTVSSPEVIRDVLYDDRDGSRPFADFVDRVGKYWHSRITSASVDGKLSSSDRQSILKALAPDFDLRPSLRSQVGQVEGELARFTNQQEQTFKAILDNPRVIVRGGAGTGKTFLALNEAHRLASQGKKVLLTCFNKRLAHHLAPAAVGFPTLRIVHLHGLMSEVVSAAGLETQLPDAEPADLFQVFYPELALRAFLDDAQSAFDALVIDEGQDVLIEPYVDLFDGMLAGGLRKGTWRLFVDPYQDIFEGTAPRGLSRFLEVNPTACRLTLNCRNTNPIAVTTSLLSGAPLDDVSTIDGPDVVAEWYTGQEEGRHKASKIVRQWVQAGIRPAEIVVLSHRTLQNSCLAAGLVSAPVRLADVASGPLPADSVAFSTIHAFKGLEATAAVLVDVDDILGPQNAAAVYVGASRATTILAVLLKRSDGLQKAYEQRAALFGQRLASSS